VQTQNIIFNTNIHTTAISGLMNSKYGNFMAYTRPVMHKIIFKSTNSNCTKML